MGGIESPSYEAEPLERTAEVLRLLAISEEQRDLAWRREFYAAAPGAYFAAGDPKGFSGPDGLPYFSMVTPQPGRMLEAYSIAHLLERATEDGFGIALNHRGEEADWVFRYGDLFSLRRYDDLEVEQPGPSILEPGAPPETVLLASPSEDFLPVWARRVVKDFLSRRLGVKQPGVLVVARGVTGGVPELAFNLYAEDFKLPAAFQEAMDLLGWFLPRHYSLVQVAKRDPLEAHFNPL